MAFKVCVLICGFALLCSYADAKSYCWRFGDGPDTCPEVEEKDSRHDDHFWPNTRSQPDWLVKKYCCYSGIMTPYCCSDMEKNFNGTWRFALTIIILMIVGGLCVYGICVPIFLAYRFRE